MQSPILMGNRNHSGSVQHAALITVGNIVTNDDEQTQNLISYGILPRLRRLLSHTKKNILKDTCFTISNIAAGRDQSQISAIIEDKVIPALVLLFDTSSEVDIKAEVTWALANALSNGTEEQIRHVFRFIDTLSNRNLSYLINQGCVRCLCEQLEHYDTITIEAVVESIEKIIRAGEAVLRPNKFIPHLIEVARDPLLRCSRFVVSEANIQLKISHIMTHLQS
jgi:importin subunit alpha-6/7